MDKKYDFSGWATRNDLVCADGRTIRRDAFKHCDGKTVPLNWNHRNDSPDDILGKALLENRTDGVYVYGTFNNNAGGQAARELLEHGDILSLSICANNLKQTPNRDVLHGDIKEVSLVPAGANPGAFIDFVALAHNADGFETEAIIGAGEGAKLYHSDEEDETLSHADSDSDEETVEDVLNSMTEKQQAVVLALIDEALKKDEDSKDLSHSDAKGEDEDKDKDKDKDDSDEETIEDILDSMTEKQQTVVLALIDAALKTNPEDDKSDNSEKTEGGTTTMKHNAFEAEENKETTLSHSDKMSILELAKTNSVGSLQTAIKIFKENNEQLAHGLDNVDRLFPEFKDVQSGAPERLTRDHGWVNAVLKGVHKSPIGRIRTKYVDARAANFRGKGFSKTNQKQEAANMAAYKRTTDPQTVYVLDSLHRDDVVDITDFDVVAYEYDSMREILEEEIAIAVMVGDGRDPSAEDKISESHIRSIWNDGPAYVIRTDIDTETIAAEINGEEGVHFGTPYIFAEAVIAAVLHAREEYKGTGTPDLFCTRSLVSTMLLARDLNGRRIYNNKADLAAALDVNDIYTAEQFNNLIRTDETDNSRHKFVGILVNLDDYTIGSVKGGEITKFEDFDIDFNKLKYLMEARISGALARPLSAIVLEQPVANG